MMLPKSTRKFDQSQKRSRRQSLPTLEKYILVEQDKGKIRVFSRSEGWQSNYYCLGDEIVLPSLDIAAPVDTIYNQVDSEAVAVYLERQQ
ncbi:MAG: hypothetical protein ACU836_16170 [Gammaproteobacteria bacterium]